MFLTQQPRVRFSAFPKIYFLIAEIYPCRWLEESGQRLLNVDRTHLVLASGKLLLQKKRVHQKAFHESGNSDVATSLPKVNYPKLTRVYAEVGARIEANDGDRHPVVQVVR